MNEKAKKHATVLRNEILKIEQSLAFLKDNINEWEDHYEYIPACSIEDFASYVNAFIYNCGRANGQIN